MTVARIVDEMGNAHPSQEIQPELLPFLNALADLVADQIAGELRTPVGQSAAISDRLKFEGDASSPSFAPEHQGRTVISNCDECAVPSEAGNGTSSSRLPPNRVVHLTAPDIEGGLPLAGIETDASEV